MGKAVASVPEVGYADDMPEVYKISMVRMLLRSN
jgi:hypothetical protein